jgi:hypothetical protein
MTFNAPSFWTGFLVGFLVTVCNAMYLYAKSKGLVGPKNKQNRS